MTSERRIILRRKTESSKLVSSGGESIPIDLIIEIFSRLPANSVVRFRCLSKFWASILRRPDFTELFFTRSSSRPQVLFAFQKLNEVFFFSIPQPRNHEEIVSPVVANFVMKTPFRAKLQRLSSINGFLFLREEFISDTANTDTELKTAVMFNPSTRQSLSLPNLNFKWRNSCKCFMGYDPIEKQYKLLFMTLTNYKVLTLGSGNLLWRDILCCTKHRPQGDGVCIDGVLYYLARVKNAADVGYTTIVSFDIKSEKFTFIKTMKIYIEECCIATVVNYNGKLATFKENFDGRSKKFEIWVLEDPEKQVWSQHIHVLPPLWKDVVGESNLSIVEMIGTDEIVLSPIYCNSSFYLIYYNLKKESVVKVYIRGMETSKYIGVKTSLNHVENLKLLS